MSQSSNAGATAHVEPWKSREQGEEEEYVRKKTQEQLKALRESEQAESGEDPQNQSQSNTLSSPDANTNVPERPVIAREDRDYEAGFGGQEDLEDRFATTSGEH